MPPARSSIFRAGHLIGIFIIFLADLTKGEEEKYTAYSGTDRRLCDGKVGGFHQDPEDTHDGAVCHENDDGLKQSFCQVDAYRTDDQQHQQDDPEYRFKTHAAFLPS